MSETELSLLLEDLRSENSSRRRDAVAALARLTESDDIEKLIPLLLDPDPRARYHVQRALLTLGAPAVSALTGAAGGDDPPSRYHAILTLARMKDDASLESLRLLAAHTDFQTRRLAILGLLFRADPRLPDLLDSLVNHENWEVRHTAWHFLLQTDLLKGLHALLAAAIHGDQTTTNAATQALLDASRDGGWPRLILLYRSATVVERYAALEALFAAPLLIGKRMGYDNIIMRDLCSHLLGGPPFRTLKVTLRDLRNDPDGELRLAANEVAAWRELPRPSHKSTHQIELVRGTSNPAEADSLLRGTSEPDPAPASLWQRLRARIGLE